MDDVTPKGMLLDLLRVAPHPLPVRDLVAVGELFGFEGNATRVALTRLVGRGLVESDERGSYRLVSEAGPLPRLIGGWRLGDRRMRPWKGGWLCVWHPPGSARGRRRASLEALNRFGFREGRARLWVRPDNLYAPRDQIEADLMELGLVEEAALFVGRAFPEALAAEWARSLWKLQALQKTWKRTLARLEKSRRRLRAIRFEEALVESFLAGGEAIRVLALDPLLPDEMLDGSARRELHAAMLEYEVEGKAIWNEMLTARSLEGAPSHLSAAH